MLVKIRSRNLFLVCFTANSFFCIPHFGFSGLFRVSIRRSERLSNVSYSISTKNLYNANVQKYLFYRGSSSCSSSYRKYMSNFVFSSAVTCFMAYFSLKVNICLVIMMLERLEYTFSFCSLGCCSLCASFSLQPFYTVCVKLTVT